MKRKTDAMASVRRKRHRSDDKEEYGPARLFREGDSARDQARPHRVAIAVLPVGALDFGWSVGQNRPLDERHARRLCGIFEQGGLNRKAQENYLRVLCSGADVQRMLTHVRRGESSADRGVDTVHDFRDWMSVNGGRKAELIAGQHRVRALGMYLQETGRGEEEAWWTCEFYDQGTRSDPPTHELLAPAERSRRSSTSRSQHQAPRKPPRPVAPGQPRTDLGAAGVGGVASPG